MAKKFTVEGKASTAMNQVHVKKGDTLSAISKKLTGSANNWKKIAEVNKISDPTKIKPGQTITIPEGILNPMVNLNGKEYRYRSSEYKKAYQESTPSAKDKYNEYRKGQAEAGAKAVRTGRDAFAKEVFATGLNTVDLPRRIITGMANPDYTMKQAINVVGTQPYMPLAGKEFAAKHPYVSAGIDIGTGLIGWNLPGIAKSIVGTGANLARSEAAIAQAYEATNKLAGASPAILKEAAKQSRKTTASTMARNPGKYESLTIHPTSGVESAAASKTVGNTNMSTKVGARTDFNRGKGFNGPKSSRTSVGRGQANAAYTPGSENVGTFQYPIPVPPIVIPPIIPIPGVPAYPTLPPPVVPTKERLESVVPQQTTLSEIIRKIGAQPGDTLQFPTGEQIVYQRGNAPKERIFDVATTKTYDASSTPQEQYNVPGRTQLEWGKRNAAIGKFIPAIPGSERRDSSIYYPKTVVGKSTYKPIK